MDSQCMFHRNHTYVNYSCSCFLCHRSLARRLHPFLERWILGTALVQHANDFNHVDSLHTCCVASDESLSALGSAHSKNFHWCDCADCIRIYVAGAHQLGIELDRIRSVTEVHGAST